MSCNAGHSTEERSSTWYSGHLLLLRAVMVGGGSCNLPHSWLKASSFTAVRRYEIPQIYERPRTRRFTSFSRDQPLDCSTKAEASALLSFCCFLHRHRHRHRLPSSSHHPTSSACHIDERDRLNPQGCRRRTRLHNKRVASPMRSWHRRLTHD